MISAVKEKYKEFIRVLTKLGRVIRYGLPEEMTVKWRPKGLCKRQVKMGEKKGNHICKGPQLGSSLILFFFNERRPRFLE